MLFVDDDRQILEGIRRALAFARDGWDMTFTTSGIDALEQLEHHQADVVVSDIDMPDMSGLVLLRTLQSRHPRILRVLLSGIIEAQSLVEAGKCANLHLCKPCSAHSIHAKILDAVAKRPIPIA